MTATAAAASTTVRLRRWLSVRHSLGLEAALVLSLYGVYELARGLVVGNTTKADRHAEQLVAVERSLHLLPMREVTESIVRLRWPGSVFVRSWTAFVTDGSRLVAGSPPVQRRDRLAAQRKRR
jgi:hypothetical protein